MITPSCMSAKTLSLTDFCISQSINTLYGIDNHNAYSFIKRHLIARVIAATTSAFCAIDFSFHLMAGFVSGAVYLPTKLLHLLNIQIIDDNTFKTMVSAHFQNALQSFLGIFYGSLLGLFDPRRIPVQFYPRSENSLDKIPVFMFHNIGEDENFHTISPQRLRACLDHLRTNNYQLITVKELSENRFADNTPLDPNQKYAVITFDEGTFSQFNYLPDGRINPDSAVGILEQYKLDHGDNFRVTASFFLSTKSTPHREGRRIFSQRGRTREKLRFLLNNNYEIGSHGSKHVCMGKLSARELDRNLRSFFSTMRRYLPVRRGPPNYRQITTLCYPYGSRPTKRDCLNVIRRHFPSQRTVRSLPYGQAKRGQSWNIPRISISPWSGFEQYAK